MSYFKNICLKVAGPLKSENRVRAPGIYQQISDPVFILFNKFLCEYLRTVNIANLTFQSKTGTIANSLTVLGGCKDGICNLIETYSKEKINNALEFIDQSVISTQLDRRPTRRKTGTRLIEEFIVDAHIPSSVASNDKCDELRRTIVELKDIFVEQIENRFPIKTLLSGLQWNLFHQQILIFSLLLLSNLCTITLKLYLF